MNSQSYGSRGATSNRVLASLLLINRPRRCRISSYNWLEIMQNYSTLTSLTLISLLTGCVLQQEGRVVQYPPAPASPPPVVVVTPPPSRPAPVLASAPPSAKDPWVSVTISSQERQAVQQHLANREDEQSEGRKGKGKHLPPGLARKAARGEPLPAGWQKKFVPGETIPAEIYHQCEPVPAQVVAHLPPPPPGTILVTVEGKIVRLLQATLEILDVLDVHVSSARP